MKVGDLVEHKLLPVYGIGVVIEMRHRHLTFDRAIVYFTKFRKRCGIKTKDLKVINESR